MSKYSSTPRVKIQNRTWPDRSIVKAPMWCSVDLRDGNQALAQPMSVDEKLAMFELLTRVGFKEIEVGFPSASIIEFDFQRRLIEEDRIPADVTIQLLCQCRKELIERSFESLKGAQKAIFHIYNSTSPMQRKITFRMEKKEIVEIAVNAVRLVKKMRASLPGTDLRLEYSPESFSQTEPEFAVEICEAVMREWGPSVDDKVILNLPATVESSTPNLFADQVEWFCRNLPNRDMALISIHNHNDRGTAVGACELGLLAGADRIEGTLFGNGERTGNLDVVTMALNMFVQGIDPGLDFSRLPEIGRLYTEYTRMEIPPRQPYVGELVFTAFSGSHQDAIKKGFDIRTSITDPNAPWEVPYLPIDPKDISREYSAIIRINSQSGKGGVAYILEHDFGLKLPKPMHPEIGRIVNESADRLGKELDTESIYTAFRSTYLDSKKPIDMEDVKIYSPYSHSSDMKCEAEMEIDGKRTTISSLGKGPIDAFVNALTEKVGKVFTITDFHEHSMGRGSDMDAVAYTEIMTEDGRRWWGCGIDSNISLAGVKSVISAFNRAFAIR